MRRRQKRQQGCGLIQEAPEPFDLLPLDPPKRERRIIGIDGEGMDTPDGRHIYTYLAAVDDTGKLVAEAFNEAGLSHDECMRMLLSLPRGSLNFGYMFSYDVTKILEPLTEDVIYDIVRPRPSVRRECSICRADVGDDAVKCGCGGAVRKAKRYVRSGSYGYEYFAGSLKVMERAASGEKHFWRRTTKIWDCFKFFGCSFVEALKNWGIGTSEQIARIADMKGKRGAFDREAAEDIKRYCQEECFLLAKMMRKLIASHRDAGLDLKRYEGAGSTATVLLKAYNVGAYKGEITSVPLDMAVRSAFFGGRFEHSIIGEVPGPVYGADIASAYPYALAELPCVDCGRWHEVQGPGMMRAIRTADLALCRFRVRAVPESERLAMAWGPLPFRDDQGSICYPTNCEGWAWRTELESAMRAFPGLIEVLCAWVYHTRCAVKPFAFLPKMYRKRVEWGKEGAGLTLKLGINAAYGKTAQAVGSDPPFRSLIWAGVTTSNTRAMLLDAIATAKDRWNVYAVATDGIFAGEPLRFEKPRDTGTGDLPKPLGLWEEKLIDEGAFFVKPGLYFRLHAQLSDMRARGVGRRELFEKLQTLREFFPQWDRKDFEAHVSVRGRRFYAAKNSIYARTACRECRVSWPGNIGACPACGNAGDTEYHFFENDEGKPLYGTWLERETKIQFDPRPKRETCLDSGGPFTRLSVRDVGGAVSRPYAKGLKSPEGLAMALEKEFALGQADWYDESD